MRHAHAMSSPSLETLRTPRLVLEPLEEAHARALLARMGCDALHEFNWALWSMSCDRPIGLLEATVHPDHTAYMTSVLFDEAWRHGYAREASAALIDHLHDQWGVSEVWAAVDPRNRRLIALLEGLGFLRIVELRSAQVTRGEFFDQYVFCLSLDPPWFRFLA